MPDYNPEHYFHTAFHLHNSTLRQGTVYVRALMTTLPAAGAAALEHYYPGQYGLSGVDYLEAYFVIVALLVSFRLHDAYDKWRTAAASVVAIETPVNTAR